MAAFSMSLGIARNKKNQSMRRVARRHEMYASLEMIQSHIRTNLTMINLLSERSYTIETPQRLQKRKPPFRAVFFKLLLCFFENDALAKSRVKLSDLDLALDSLLVLARPDDMRRLRRLELYKADLRHIGKTYQNGSIYAILGRCHLSLPSARSRTLLYLEVQFPISQGDRYGSSFKKSLINHHRSKRRKDGVLYRAAERPSSVLRVVSFLREPFVDSGIDIEGNALLSKTLYDFLDLRIYDACERFLREWIKDNNVVKPVEEFR